MKLIFIKDILITCPTVRFRQLYTNRYDFDWEVLCLQNLLKYTVGISVQFVSPYEPKKPLTMNLVSLTLYSNRKKNILTKIPMLYFEK